MSVVKNNDFAAVFFTDCPKGMSIDARVLWLALWDCVSSRVNGFCYFSDAAKQFKIGWTDFLTKEPKKWTRGRLSRATLELEHYGRIKHHGSWNDGTKFKSNVYWVAKFADNVARSPDWQRKILLHPHGEVILSKARKHIPWSKRKTKVKFTETNVGIQTEVVKILGGVETQQNTTTNVRNQTTNCLIRERVNNSIQPEPDFKIPECLFDVTIPPWKRVQEFLVANGEEGAFEEPEWHAHILSLGFISAYNIDNIPECIWSLVKAKEKALVAV